MWLFVAVRAAGVLCVLGISFGIGGYVLYKIYNKFLRPKFRKKRPPTSDGDDLSQVKVKVRAPAVPSDGDLWELVHDLLTLSQSPPSQSKLSPAAKQDHCSLFLSLVSSFIPLCCHSLLSEYLNFYHNLSLKHNLNDKKNVWNS